MLRLPDSEYQSRVILTIKRESYVVLQVSFLLKGGRLDMRAVSVSQSHRNFRRDKKTNVLTKTVQVSKATLRVYLFENFPCKQN